MITLKRWMAEASPEDKVRLARKVGTTVGYLRQVAHDDRTVSAPVADRFAQQGILVAKVSDTCRGCPFYRAR